MTDDPILDERYVDNPLTTWAQFLHEMEHGKPDAGRIKATVNLRTLMGGFCRFHGDEAQQKAATRYKALYERSQMGGSKAVDPSIEAVDGGNHNPEAIFEIGADARKTLALARSMLTDQVVRRVEFVIVGEHGPSRYAQWRYREAKPDGRTIGRAQVEFRGYMDQLAKHWRLA